MQPRTLQRQTWQFGDIRISKIPEIPLSGSQPATLFPDGWNETWLSPLAQQLDAHSLSSNGLLEQSVHSWLVQTPQHNILIDTATGNGKHFPELPRFHQLNSQWLENLQALGVSEVQIDYVLLTHLHVDHVGWNTQYSQGEWRPRFTNATYFLSAREQRQQADNLQQAQPTDLPSRIYAESIAPIIASGRYQFIPENGVEILPGIRFLSTPGHSVDHQSIIIDTPEGTAFFSGDLMHHPLQVYYPQLNSRYCEAPDLAKQSRLKALDYASSGDVIWFSSHFADTSAGRVTRVGEGYSWSFLAERA
ncbi:MBL fold metallo-hydrolase [Rouxiella sp. Mn2063]|uniref:MBL fold metallo-hydrolase n=1 Tax=Rouxiella sp. Mn2063 TaxID=3395262 RepID=UPI003BBA43A5